ncbi:hypothetical protein [Paraburkholderia sp.]|uniref:hypothetical protein n=1 Tax=Paraburkholderia sp. TaxID=1926495 RepID=UPI00238AD3FC|nr:hypothetical protein [Paraburkholderia sp.]MDE1183582.1 hypothetical protein [Paraburkholderia sp.]
MTTIEELPPTQADPESTGIPTPGMRLTSLALDILCARLQAYGNRLGSDHRKALNMMLDGFTRLAEGARDRRAFGAPTGSGKSQAIVAWCAAAHRLGRLGSLSVAIACEQVESLCDLVREMVKAGVPRDSIGLFHKYDLDPTSGAWTTGAPPPGYCPPDGKSSMAADSAPHTRPILLCTHMRVKNGNALDWYHYQGLPRSLLINDEAMFRSEGKAMTWLDLADAMDAATRRLAFGAARDFLAGVEQTVERELRRQAKAAESGKACEPKPFRIELSEPERDQHRRELTDALRQTSGSRSAKDLRAHTQTLRDFIEMCGTDTIVTGIGHADALLTFRPCLDDGIQGVAVLDASFRVRMLYQYDKTLKDALVGYDARIKTFENVTVRHTHLAAGRESVTADLDDKGPGRFIDYVVNAVKCAPVDEHVLVFTFKTRETRNAMDYEGILRDGLRRAGIDPNEQIPLKAEVDPVNAGSLRPRVNFLTWGQETSRSDLKFCTTVVLAGLQFLPREAVHAQMRGQARDIALSTTTAEVSDVHLSETISAIYQASARGSSRTMDNGKACRMVMHLPNATSTRKVRSRLREVMPGVQWVSEPDPVVDVAEAMERYLTDQPSNVTKVSLKKLNDEALAGLAERWGDRLTRRVIETGRDDMGRECGTWRRDGRSMVRV